jgi:hypothetical protein
MQHAVLYIFAVTQQRADLTYKFPQHQNLKATLTSPSTYKLITVIKATIYSAIGYQYAIKLILPYDIIGWYLVQGFPFMLMARFLSQSRQGLVVLGSAIVAG